MTASSTKPYPWPIKAAFGVATGFLKGLTWLINQIPRSK
jgi:hypothetical protein